MYKEYDCGCFLLCPGDLRACKVYFNSWKIMTLVNKLLIVGFDKSVLRRRAVEDRMMAEQARRPVPELPPQKEFKPKMGLTKLPNYKKLPLASYWNDWPKRTFEQALPSTSWVSSTKLKELATQYGYTDWARLERSVQRLDNGASIGCLGRGRLPTFSGNAPSTYEYGDRVADALAEWIKDGIMVGPLDEEELPWRDVTVSGMMVRLKPSGKPRIIVNLSAPRNEEGPGSVNSGIKVADFPAKMSSTAKFVESLFRVGRNALITKSDWNSAYKHQFVREEDLKLQFVKFMGKFFCELALVFGAISSPGIYDDLAKVVLGIAIKKSKMHPALVSQHLDDVVGVGPNNTSAIWDFDRAYREVCAYVGVSLADRKDKDKSFAPCHAGLVLGVWYDTKDFTWSLRSDKLNFLLHDLKEAIDNELVTLGKMLSISGKIINVRMLVPGGKFRLGYILMAASNAPTKDKTWEMKLSANCREQLYWWYLKLQVCSERTPITTPDTILSPFALQAYTDAAGGTVRRVGHGVGGILGDTWFYIPWPHWLNAGKGNAAGVKFDRKMSVLEMLGPLGIIVGAPNRVRNKHVEVFVDNQGAVSIYAKGYSTSCVYCYTVAMAIHDVAAALNCTIVLTKVPRCSDRETIIADCLSKADFKQFYDLMPERKLEPARIPAALLRWINDPTEDTKLGQKILKEMAQYTMVLGYNC